MKSTKLCPLSFASPVATPAPPKEGVMERRPVAEEGRWLRKWSKPEESPTPEEEDIPPWWCPRADPARPMARAELGSIPDMVRLRKRRISCRWE